MSNSRLETLQRHLDAENAHDVAAIMATYVPNPSITLNGKRIEGLEKIELFHRRFGFGGDGRFERVHVLERHRHVTNDAITIEQTLSASHPVHGAFTLDVCTVYRFAADGLLESETVYMDESQLPR